MARRAGWTFRRGLALAWVILGVGGIVVSDGLAWAVWSGVPLVLAGLSLRWPRASLLTAAGLLLYWLVPQAGWLAAPFALTPAGLAWVYGRYPAAAVSAVLAAGVLVPLRVGVGIGLLPSLLVVGAVLFVGVVAFNMRSFAEAKVEVADEAVPESAQVDVSVLAEAGFKPIGLVRLTTPAPSGVDCRVYSRSDGRCWAEVAGKIVHLASAYGHRRLTTMAGSRRVATRLPARMLAQHAGRDPAAALALHEQAMEAIASTGLRPDALHPDEVVQRAAADNAEAVRLFGSRSLFAFLRNTLLPPSADPIVDPTDERIDRWLQSGTEAPADE